MRKAATYKRWYPLVKWLLGFASLVYLYLQWDELVGEEALRTAEQMKAHPAVLVFLLFLMFINYGLESEKFRLLLNHANRPGRFRSLLVIFSGVTISNFTPAKTGEYLGRSVLLPNFTALKVILATVTGNLLQLFWTYASGLLAFLILFGLGRLPEDFDKYRWEIALAVGVVVIGGVLIRYLPRLYRPLVQRVPGSWQDSLDALRSYRGRIMDRALVLSFFRYVVFSLQYFLWIYVLADAGVPLYTFFFIPMIFLMQSLVPVPSAVDVGFRLYFAQLFFGSLLAPSSLLYAVLGIWLINLILPAVIGALYLLLSHFERK